ncbi:MAG: PTS sugar transporter subunit IIA [Elusimicrobiota bacterium]|jgi:mannitol/fructose-specific phosphotransferase system IIA component (Ntr-type)|nr:PTS sugar transporter subunit IIA [Elusimicrobiota bacterium]
MFESIRIVESVTDWKEAIRESSKPLVEHGYVKPSYVDAMIESVEEFGFYVVLTDGVAMPHARSEKGAIKTAIAFMKLNKPVLFGDKEVFLVLPLSAQDNETHMEYMIKMADFLDNPERIQKIKHMKTVEEIEAFLKEQNFA